MSSDKHKALQRRLDLLPKTVRGFAVSKEGRPPLSDKVIQDCITRKLVLVKRENSGSWRGKSNYTRIYITKKGIDELKKNMLWSEEMEQAYNEFSRPYTY